MSWDQNPDHLTPKSSLLSTDLPFPPQRNCWLAGSRAASRAGVCRHSFSWGSTAKLCAHSELRGVGNLVRTLRRGPQAGTAEVSQRDQPVSGPEDASYDGDSGAALRADR